MGSAERAFDALDLEIIHHVYEAAWIRLIARNPVRSPEDQADQKNLRKRLFVLAKPGAVDFDKLYAEVVASYEIPRTTKASLCQLRRAWQAVGAGRLI